MDDEKGRLQCLLILKIGLAALLIGAVISFVLSFLGGILILSVIGVTFYMITSLATRRKPVGNLLRSYVPPRTKWCTKIEYDHILVPADVDEALERCKIDLV